MSSYQSADSTNASLCPHFEDQSSAIQFDARSKQQHIDGLAFSSQVFERPQHQFDDPTRVYDGQRQQFDNRTSNTLAVSSRRQHVIEKNTEGECHPSIAQFRDRHPSSVADLNTSSDLFDGSQLCQPDNQHSTAHLPSGRPVPENSSAEPAPFRLPTFIYREPLPPYVPDMSSPTQYHGKVVPPHRLGSYFLPRQEANPMPRPYPQRARQPALDQTEPVYPRGVSNTATGPALPQPPKSYLAWSIVSMLFCCPVLGIAAVVFSSSVNTDYAAGRYDKARSKSTDARSLNIAATIAFLLSFVATGIYYAITISNSKAAG